MSNDLDASNKALWAEVKAVRAENDRLRSELADERNRGDHLHARWDKAEAAIARAREVCMQDSWDIKLAGVGFVDVRLVLRALDGSE